MSLWELVLAAIGLYLLVVGRLSLMGREVRGRVARQIGLLLMAPPSPSAAVVLRKSRRENLDLPNMTRLLTVYGGCRAIGKITPTRLDAEHHCAILLVFGETRYDVF